MMRAKINKRDFVPARVNTSISPGEMLKTLRELQEMTQEQLAKASGIRQSNISALESGARQIGRERAVLLARALKVHPAVILFPDYDSEQAA
jgi:transcriptional regulator with XRE-family HTH domain